MVNYSGLNPIFAARISAAIGDAEKATGGKAAVTSAYRTYADQVNAWNNYQSGRGGIAARPGKSLHEQGMAFDLGPGPVRDWIEGHAAQYGLEAATAADRKKGTWGQDAPHIQLARSVLTTPYDSTPNAFADGGRALPGVPIDPFGVVAAKTSGALPSSGLPSPQTLRRGMSGPSVAALQTQLASHALYRGPIDGKFGPATQTAVKNAESMFSLPTRDRGVAGPQVQTALGIGLPTPQMGPEQPGTSTLPPTAMPARPITPTPASVAPFSTAGLPVPAPSQGPGFPPPAGLSNLTAMTGGMGQLAGSLPSTPGGVPAAPGPASPPTGRPSIEAPDWASNLPGWMRALPGASYLEKTMETAMPTRQSVPYALRGVTFGNPADYAPAAVGSPPAAPGSIPVATSKVGPDPLANETGDNAVLATMRGAPSYNPGKAAFGLAPISDSYPPAPPVPLDYAGDRAYAAAHAPPTFFAGPGTGALSPPGDVSPARSTSINDVLSGLGGIPAAYAHLLGFDTPPAAAAAPSRTIAPAVPPGGAGTARTYPSVGAGLSAPYAPQMQSSIGGYPQSAMMVPPGSPTAPQPWTTPPAPQIDWSRPAAAPSQEASPVGQFGSAGFSMPPSVGGFGERRNAYANGETNIDPMNLNALPTRFNAPGYQPFPSGAQPALYASAGSAWDPRSPSVNGDYPLGRAMDSLGGPAAGDIAPSVVTPAGGPPPVPSMYGSGLTAPGVSNGISSLFQPLPAPPLAVRPSVAKQTAAIATLAKALGGSARSGGGYVPTTQFGGSPGSYNYSGTTPWGSATYNAPYGASGYSNSPFTPAGYTAPNFSVGSGGPTYAYKPDGQGGGTYVNSFGQTMSY